jgi:hypothetical protein
MYLTIYTYTDIYVINTCIVGARAKYMLCKIMYYTYIMIHYISLHIVYYM